jgi:uracil-DNA glycosylase family 4
VKAIRIEMPAAAPSFFSAAVLAGLCMTALEKLNRTVVRCRKCPRLVRWREQAAKKPPLRYRGQKYWAKPLAGFGDPAARVLIVGLAPAAHGGNRTGRIFTGDRSGDWLYGTLHAFGFSSHPTSVHRDDGLTLADCYISAAVRCAPPANKPAPLEFERCRPYLVRELQLLKNIRVVVALGKIAFDSFLKAYRENGGVVPKPRPQFGHGSLAELGDGLTLLGSYHPSQQNTFTGRLTREMFHAVFRKAKEVLSVEC